MDPQFIGEEGQRLSGHVWCFGSDLRMPILLSVSWCCDGQGNQDNKDERGAYGIQDFHTFSPDRA
jgi:hypothetical protein